MTASAGRSGGPLTYLLTTTLNPLCSPLTAYTPPSTAARPPPHHHPTTARSPHERAASILVRHWQQHIHNVARACAQCLTSGSELAPGKTFRKFFGKFASSAKIPCRKFPRKFAGPADSFQTFYGNSLSGVHVSWMTDSARTWGCGGSAPAKEILVILPQN